MKNTDTFIFIFIASMLLLELPVFAYLDPGVGSVLLQFLAGVAIAIGIGWRFIVRFFKKLFSGKKDDQHK